MSSSKQEQLRQLIDMQQHHVRLAFSVHREQAIVALTRAHDWRFLQQQDMLNMLPTYTDDHRSYLYFSGWQKALQLCFGDGAEPSDVSSLVLDSTLDEWADQILVACDALAAAEQVASYCETGFMRMQRAGEGDFFAWIASKKLPTEWREREDIAWWTDMLAQIDEHEIQKLAAEKVEMQQRLDAFANQWQVNIPIYRTTWEIDDYYNRLGALWIRWMSCHFLYPAHTLIGGCTAQIYRNVLATLIGWALKHLAIGKAFVLQHPSFHLRSLLATPHDAHALIEALSKTLKVDSERIRCVVEAYSLHRENSAYHCSLAGNPAPPLLRLNRRYLVFSLEGLLSKPFFFLTRELKRRNSYEYHTVSHVHEETFRQDLYELFWDKRFVRSEATIELRDTRGKPMTDVDALIFDRKTGALALFELKSQDPFAYSHQERRRQRDYFYNAKKQVVNCVDWLNRNGANALLARLDAKQVKHLKVQKTYIFVLGRYLAHFFDGPEFDGRAAWGTWPQVLRLVDGRSFGSEDTHPMQSLYNKLLKDTSPRDLSSILSGVQEIPLGKSTIVVCPHFEMYKKRIGESV